MELRQLVSTLKRRGRHPRIGGNAIHENIAPAQLLDLVSHHTVLGSLDTARTVLEFGLSEEAPLLACYGAFFDAGAKPRTQSSLCQFSGGRGGSSISKEAVEQGRDITVIVNAYDDGLSTGKMRKWFDILGPSDVRKNLLALHGRDDAARQAMHDLFALRVNDFDQLVYLIEEIGNLLEDPEHHVEIPQIRALNLPAIDRDRLSKIFHGLNDYFRVLDANKATDVDFDDIAIGNILYVVWLARCNGQLNFASRVLQAELLDARGQVLVVNEDQNWLCGVTAGGIPIRSEADLVEKHWEDPVQSLFLVPHFLRDEDVRQLNLMAKREKLRRLGTMSRYPIANIESVVRLLQADVIVYSPGTLHSSLLPTFMAKGVGEAIANSRALKVLFINIVNDRESLGYTVEDYLKKYLEVLYQDAPTAAMHEFFDYVVVDRQCLSGHGSDNVGISFDPNIADRYPVGWLVKDVRKDGHVCHDGARMLAYLDQLAALKQAGIHLYRGRLVAEEDLVHGLAVAVPAPA